MSIWLTSPIRAIFFVREHKVDPASTEREWSDFIARLVAESDGPRLTAVRIAELPSYRGIPLQDLLPAVTRDFVAALPGLRDRRPPGPAQDVSAFEKTGEQRARQGITLADLIQGWAIGLEVSRADAFRWVPPGEHREALLLEAVELMTAWNHLGMNASVAAHRRVELRRARLAEHDAANVVRGVLLGAPGELMLGELDRFGVDAGLEHHAIRVRPRESFDLGEIERWLGTGQSAQKPNGLVALIDGDVAGFVADPPADLAAPVCAGVAGPVPLAAIGEAFRLASRALEAASATGRSGLTEFSSLGLIPSVLGDADVGRSVLDRYVRPLELDGRAGTTVLRTVAAFLDNDCQVPQTAAALGVHRNTVRYRIGRFEQLTGCSLRHTAVLVEVWWALRRHGMR
jgi:hypothetical protein